MNIEITVREIHQICWVVYALGLLTAAGVCVLARAWREWRAERRRREQFRIHRRTPFGI